jgi:4-hydroxybenzoate polyprenyltransferase
MRTKEWASHTGFLLLGLLPAHQAPAAVDWPRNILVFASFALIYSFGFALNDAFDAKTDKLQSGKRNVITEGGLSQKRGVGFALLLGFAGLGLASFLPRLSLFFFALLFVLLYCYSGPPFRFKGKVPMDILTHGFFIAVLPLAGYLAVKQLDAFIALIAILTWFLSVTVEILQEIRDFRGDLKAGYLTTVGRLGVSRSIGLIKILLLASAGVFVLLVAAFLPLYMASLAFALLPYNVIFRKSDWKADAFFSAMTKANNKAIAVLALLAALVFPFWVGLI